MASISGTVTNSSGGGLSGITVQATGGGTPGSATTNSSGNYQITNLSAGTYNVLPVPGAGTFTPNNYSVTLTQNQNATGRNFQKQSPHGGKKSNK
jgi:hypothetical protein